MITINQLDGRSVKLQDQNYAKLSQGFSLVEILVAVGILGGAIIVLFLTLHSGSLESKISEDRLKGMLIAQREIERAKQVAALGRGSLDEYWSGGAKKRSYMVENLYRVQVTVNPNKSISVGGSKCQVGEISVSVKWDRLGRSNQKVEISTLFDQAYH